MKPHAIVTALALASVSFVGGRLALADKPSTIEVRQVNTATRVIGCSAYIDKCDGMSSIRTGLVVVDVQSVHLRSGPLSFVGMFQASARARDALLWSQAMFGGGPRLTLGRHWIQAGLGVADSRLAPGPKTIAATLVAKNMRPAAMAAIGTHVALFDLPLEISLDVGSNLGVRDDEHFGDVHQVTANVFTAL